MELVDDYNADEMGELIPKAAAAASVAQSVDLIMPKQFAVQTRTIILNMLVRDGMNDEFICIYFKYISSHSSEVVFENPPKMFPIFNI